MSYPPRNKYGMKHIEQMTVIELEMIIKRCIEWDEGLHLHSDCLDFLYEYALKNENVNWMPEGYHLYSPFDPAHLPKWTP